MTKNKNKMIHALGELPRFESVPDDGKQRFMFHPQAVGSLMVAVQYAMMTALLEKDDDKVVDLSEVLASWTLSVDEKTGLLLVDNPPEVSWEEKQSDEEV